MTAAVAVLLLLSGCAGGTGPAAQQGDDIALLSCDELVPAEDLVAAALTGADEVQPTPMSAMPPLEFDPFLMLLPAAGGLRCSWNAGTPAVDWASDWAYLSVEALPYAGDPVIVRTPEGEPIEPTRLIGGYAAIATCQDGAFECVVGASVEGVWLQVRLHWTDFKSDSRFAELDHEVMLDRVAAIAEPAFATVAAAETARLDWPTATGDTGADCEGIGTPTPIPPEYVPNFSSQIAKRANLVMCTVGTDYIAIVPGAGSIVNAIMQEPDFDVALEPFDDRIGYPALGRALAPGASLVMLTIEEDAYLIIASDAVARARDILAARVTDYEGPQRAESLQATDIATAEAEGLALVEATAAELGLTIAKTYPPERRRCEHADGFTGVVSDVAVNTDASSTPDEELFERASRYWTSRELEVYRPDNGIAAEGVQMATTSARSTSPRRSSAPGRASACSCRARRSRPEGNEEQRGHGDAPGSCPGHPSSSPAQAARPSRRRSSPEARYSSPSAMMSSRGTRAPFCTRALAPIVA